MVFLRRDKRMYNGDSSELLNSWKEIAAYLHRGVRTVQRWESELDLPGRRPSGRSRSAVMAMRSELDEWSEACPVTITGRRTQHGVSSASPAATPALSALFYRSRQLGLPVRRPRGKDRSAVIAIRSELDEWIKACPVTSTGKRMQHVVSSAPPPARPALRSLIVRSCQLRMDVSRRCDDLTTSLNKLLATLGSMMKQPDQPSNNSAQSIVKSVA